MSNVSLAVKRKSREIVNRLMHKKTRADALDTETAEAEEQRLRLLNWCAKHKIQHAAATELLSMTSAKLQKDSPSDSDASLDAEDPLLCGRTAMTADETTVNAITSSVMKALEPLFLKLTEEIEALKEDIQELSAENELLRTNAPTGLIKLSRRTICPKEPFSTLEEVLEFEEMLEADCANPIAFEQELSAISEIKNPKFVRACWRRLMTDPLAEKFSWRGTESKKSVCSLFTATSIRNVFIKEKGGTDKDFVEATKAFFQFARNRQKQRQRYVKKYETV